MCLRPRFARPADLLVGLGDRVAVGARHRDHQPSALGPGGIFDLVQHDGLAEASRGKQHVRRPLAGGVAGQRGTHRADDVVPAHQARRCASEARGERRSAGNVSLVGEVARSLRVHVRSLRPAMAFSVLFLPYLHSFHYVLFHRNCASKGLSRVLQAGNGGWGLPRRTAEGRVGRRCAAALRRARRRGCRSAPSGTDALLCRLAGGCSPTTGSHRALPRSVSACRPSRGEWSGSRSSHRRHRS